MKKILTIFLTASLLLVACGKDKKEKKAKKRDLEDVGKRRKVIWKYTRKMKEKEI